MASRIRAINAYRPRIKLGRTAQFDELVAHIASRTSLNTGEIIMVLMELRDAVIFFNRDGRGVKLEGLGTYLPNMQLDGSFDVQHRLDRSIKRALNTREFWGTILNRKNVGKTPDELVAQWNVEHPDDPVT
ncbi:MAG: hypothetical protein SVX38_09880 [Chloroflexota bacterium]|nr:hypothetical protein [Chloroflexota bacterium]